MTSLLDNSHDDRQLGSPGGHDRDQERDNNADVAKTARHDSKHAPNNNALARSSQDAASKLDTTLPTHVNDSRPPAPSSTLPHRSLHLQTKLDPDSTAGAARETPTILTTDAPSHPSPASLSAAGSALRSNLSASSLASTFSYGANSTLPSPYLASMTDLTPLPSPLMPAETLEEDPSTPGRSRGGSVINAARSSSLPASPTSPSKKKKGYGSLMQEATIASAAAANASAFEENAKNSAHTRNRSISEFIPEQLQNIRQRHVTFGAGDGPGIEAAEYQMHREAYLAAQRGVAPSVATTAGSLPTPPPSNASVAESEEADEEQPYLEDGTATEFLEIHCGIRNKRRKFRQLRQLGQGTFSTVMLATRERIPAHPTPEIEEHLDPHKLVAVKIVGHGPAGGADEERIETGLKREVEMLKTVSHPSLIHLKACEYQEKRSLLVLTYCPGGDLFELASQKRDLLTSHLIQRMFAELVSAVRYLHEHWIVHRDIKLENVLVNLPESSLRALDNPLSHSTPIVTLTDMGLSRKIPSPPDPPLLTTRCGSEDYAAPEILLGQPYDGRMTDAWALGVVLYALMEGRLPFDAPPGRPDRSRNTHRIARCDWIWCRFGDEDGDWDSARGKDFEGARPCVENLLKKVRMGRKSLDEIAGLEWVQHGIHVEGGLRMREEDEDDEL